MSLAAHCIVCKKRLSDTGRPRERCSACERVWAIEQRPLKIAARYREQAKRLREAAAALEAAADRLEVRDLIE